ncbi:neuroblast differentiation-associated protein AHNAK-like [Morone saxatilis]|uniref:neuroblast differentiation-associated protein AHNAK-like n=1 Tax=Morone saxatilis TaxID=34816 RepID=UPI0015E236B4|nr:neuroblast differentiation-associated protein AHNAK-like [Morone saxatilis]
MAEEEETREVLFPDWEGPDKTGLTIEQTSGGEIFVKEVKGESPAARSGKVYEGDQIVGATVYFDNMSSEETAELLKTLNRHKVGLKLQNKGDKSPYCSPLSTPCRSPMGTLTWEGKTRFGGSSPDIILSGDDEDYKRIYTKKIKPRLKSEDLAEGVDVRTERHSSTSSDGSTITTITRRITTYTVEMPSGISEQLEFSNPEFKGLRHESGDGSPRIRISHGSPSGKVGAEEGVFESSNVSYTGPEVSSTETRWGSRGVQTTTITREGERGPGLKFKGPNFGVTGEGGFEISRESGEQGDGSIQVLGTSMTPSDSTNTGSRHITRGGLGGAEVTSADENGGTISLSLPGKTIQIQEGNVDTSLGERTKMKVSETTISHPQAKGSSRFDMPNVRFGGGSRGIDTESSGGRIGGSVITEGNVTSGYSSVPGKISVTGLDVNLTGSRLKGEVDANLPSRKGGMQASAIDVSGKGNEGTVSGIKMSTIKMPAIGIREEGTSVEVKLSGDADISVPMIQKEVKKPELDIKGTDMQPVVNVRLTEAASDLKAPEITSSIHTKVPRSEGNLDVTVPKTEGKIKEPKVHIKGPAINIEGKEGDFKMSQIKTPSFGAKGQNVDVKTEIDIKAPEVDGGGSNVKIDGLKFKIPSKTGHTMPELDVSLKGSKAKGNVDFPKIEGHTTKPEMEIKGPEVEGRKGVFEMPGIKMASFGFTGPKVVKGPDVDLNLPKADIDVKAPNIDIKGPEFDVEGPDAKLKGPKFKLPSLSGPTLPDWDMSLKGPKVKGDVDVSVPKIEGDIKAPKVDIEGPDVDIEGPKGGFKMPKMKMPSFGMKGPNVEGPEVDVSLPKGDIDIKGPELDIKGPGIDIESPSGKIKGPKFKMPTISGPNISMPDVDFNLKGPKLKGDMDLSAPKIEGDLKAPEIDIRSPQVDIEGPKGGFDMPNIKIPSLNIKGPNIRGPDVDLNLPKANIDVKAPDVDIKCPEIDIEGPKGGFDMPKIKVPSFGFKGPKVEGPDVDINLPKANIDVKAPDLDIGVKGPKVKGKMSASMPKLEGDIKGANANIAAPTITMEGVSIDPVKTGVTFPKFRGPKFGMKSPEVEGPDSTFKAPKFSVGAKGSKSEVSLPDTEASLDAPDIDIHVKGKKGKFKLPKVKGKAKKPDADFETPAVNLDVDTPNIHIKGTKAKKHLFGKLHFPDVELDIKSPKLKGDGSLSEGLKSPDLDLSSGSLKSTIDRPNVSLEGPDVKLKTPNIKMPNVNLSAPDIDANLNRQGEATMSAGFKGQKVNVKGGAEIDASVSAGSVSGGLHYPEGTLTFPKLKVPKFGIALPLLEGQQGGGNVESDLAASGGINMQSPSVSCQVSSQNIEVPSPELRHSEGKVKVKMPKLFGKSKPKGSVGDLQGSEVELSASGKDLSVHTGKQMGGKLELEGDSGLSVSTKGKSASLDLFKKSRHRSSSLSDEGGLAVSSPSTHLEAEGGDISLDLGGSKAKGKKGKLKFGTFGGFGSKSKGSYEVTLGEDSEAGVEGSAAGVSVHSKKSRLSSSSSSDSGSRSGFRFPRLELSVSPKK